MTLKANFITCQKFNLPYLFNDKFMRRKMQESSFIFLMITELCYFNEEDIHKMRF